MLLNKRIKDPDALPIIFILVDEFVMVGSFLILIVVVFALEDNMQANVPVADVDVAFVRFNQFTGGKKDDAGMFTQVFVAVFHELCLGGFGVIVEGEVNIVDETRGFLSIDDQLVCAAEQSQEGCNENEQCIVSHNNISKAVFRR